MSKNSQKDLSEPYYRKFGKPAWYKKQVHFPDGRHPYTDLFCDDVVAEIIRKIDPKLKPDVKVLRSDLQDLAHDYLVAAQSAPFGIGGGPKNLTRDQRKRFLKPQVVNPARKLLRALAEENAHQFFEWPDDKIGSDPSREMLVSELTRLLERVDCVLEGLTERQGDSGDTLTEFKLDFTNALRMVYQKHYPTLPAHISEYDRAKRPMSEYFKFLCLCSKEIFKDELVLAVELIDSVTEPQRKR